MDSRPILRFVVLGKECPIEIRKRCKTSYLRSKSQFMYRRQPPYRQYLAASPFLPSSNNHLAGSIFPEAFPDWRLNQPKRNGETRASGTCRGAMPPDFLAARKIPRVSLNFPQKADSPIGSFGLKFDQDRWLSGLRHSTRNRAYLHRYRGFDSHPVRPFGKIVIFRGNEARK